MGYMRLTYVNQRVCDGFYCLCTSNDITNCSPPPFFVILVPFLFAMLYKVPEELNDPNGDIIIRPPPTKRISVPFDGHSNTPTPISLICSTFLILLLLPCPPCKWTKPLPWLELYCNCPTLSTFPLSKTTVPILEAIVKPQAEDNLRGGSG